MRASSARRIITLWLRKSVRGVYDRASGFADRKYHSSCSPPAPKGENGHLWLVSKCDINRFWSSFLHGWACDTRTLVARSGISSIKTVSRTPRASIRFFAGGTFYRRARWNVIVHRAESSVTKAIESVAVSDFKRTLRRVDDDDNVCRILMLERCRNENFHSLTWTRELFERFFGRCLYRCSTDRK